MAYDELQAALAIAKLQAENRELRNRLGEAQQQIDQLTSENEQFRQRLAELERQAARQAAPFRRRDQKKVDPAKKKRSGRKPGHAGAFRRAPDHVDQEVEVPLCGCPRCGGSVDNVAPLVQYIEEIPPVRPQVTRLVTWSAECSQCGEVRSTHPLQTSLASGAAKVQLGPRALALTVLLNKKLGLTMRKTCSVLQRLCGLSVTPGGLSQALARVATKVEADYGQLIEQLRASDAVFADETSWWVGGPGWWLWAFTTPEGVTFYRVDESRGSQVVKEVLGDTFPGILVSDCLNSYDPADYRKHKCIAHHLQAISKARERPDTKDPSYLNEWKELFQQVIVLHRDHQSLPAARFAAEKTRLQAWADRLLNRSCIQSGDISVQNRLLKQQAHLLGCLDDPAAEPTNNRAERALRPAVIARKLSCGNKTENGRRSWQILTSLATTYDELPTDFVDFLAARIPLAMQPG